LIDEAPQTEINIDIPNGQVTMADISFPAKLPDHAKEALVDGKWDAIADLLEGLDQVKSTAANLPYMRVA
jgi:3-isopropylmalate/(R)-2-methylmalate dehydratase small subunit